MQIYCLTSNYLKRKYQKMFALTVRLAVFKFKTAVLTFINIYLSPTKMPRPLKLYHKYFNTISEEQEGQIKV